MDKELLKDGPDMQNYLEKNNYKRYLELGGIINEMDYTSALLRLKEAENKAEMPDKHHIKQAENIAKFARIELGNTEDVIDQRIILYGILRGDVRPKGIKYHHDQMSDQQIFMEALRMLGDVESINKITRAYPNISFIYLIDD